MKDSDEYTVVDGNEEDRQRVLASINTLLADLPFSELYERYSMLRTWNALTAFEKEHGISRVKSKHVDQGNQETATPGDSQP